MDQAEWPESAIWGKRWWLGNRHFISLLVCDLCLQRLATTWFSCQKLTGGRDRGLTGSSLGFLFLHRVKRASLSVFGFRFVEIRAVRAFLFNQTEPPPDTLTTILANVPRAGRDRPHHTGGRWRMHSNAVQWGARYALALRLYAIIIL